MLPGLSRFGSRAARRALLLVVVIGAAVVGGILLARFGSAGDQPAGDPRIAAAGDIACDPRSPAFNDGQGTSTACWQRQTSDLLVDRDLEAVLPLGDLQYEDGTRAAFRTSYDPSWGRVKSITRPVPGNHEYHTPGAAGYFDYFNGRDRANGQAGERDRGYYAYDIGSWRIFALNSTCSEVGGCEEGSPQYEWLEQELDAVPARCLLAYWHSPRFASGDHGDLTDVGDFWELLDDAGADVVLNGHEHFYERFAPQDADGNPDPDGIRQFIVGSGGKDLREVVDVAPNSEVRETETFGVLELTLSEDAYAWRFVAAGDGTFTDSGTGSC